MKVATILLLCAQIFCATAGPSRGGKEPVVTSIACNDNAAEAAADLSLRQLNANRKRGFVFGLKRISNVQEQYDEENGSVFYLTLDVLETDCHVLSRRPWTDCEAKPRHESVFGQCNVIFQLNKPKRIAHLHNYDCKMSPAARVEFGCPGCHSSQSLNDSNIQEVAKKSLEKFNKESNFNSYFGLGNITKGAQQVVAGKAYHVEFTIVESTCNKSGEDFSLCDPLDDEFAHTGYCKSKAIAHWSTPGEKKVLKVNCEIFEPEGLAGDEHNHNETHAVDHPTNDRREHGKKGDRGKGKHHGQKHGHEHAKHGNKHGHKHNHKHDHDSESHEHDHEHEHHRGQPQRPRGPPSDQPKTVGTITYLSGNEAPTTPSAAKEKEKRGDKKGQGKPSKTFIRPFPDKASTSDQCPGPAKNIPLVKDVPGTEAPQETTPLPK